MDVCLFGKSRLVPSYVVREYLFVKLRDLYQIVFRMDWLQLNEKNLIVPIVRVVRAEYVVDLPGVVSLQTSLSFWLPSPRLLRDI